MSNLEQIIADMKKAGENESNIVDRRNYILETIEDIKKTFVTKQKEYKGSTNDPYRNFNQGALLQNETPEQTLLGYVDKQVVNLFDAKHNNPERLSDVEFIKEKAGDIAVYMVILIAMAKEKESERLSRQYTDTCADHTGLKNAIHDSTCCSAERDSGNTLIRN